MSADGLVEGLAEGSAEGSAGKGGEGGWVEDVMVQ